MKAPPAADRAWLCRQISVGICTWAGSDTVEVARSVVTDSPGPVNHVWPAGIHVPCGEARSRSSRRGRCLCWRSWPVLGPKSERTPRPAALGSWAYALLHGHPDQRLGRRLHAAQRSALPRTRPSLTPHWVRGDRVIATRVLRCAGWVGRENPLYTDFPAGLRSHELTFGARWVLGDGVLVSSGTPSSLPEAPPRAASCALALRRHRLVIRW